MDEATGFTLGDGTLVRPAQPFFITGSGRCGTTLMRRLVVERSQVIIPPENYMLALSMRLLPIAQKDWASFCRLILSGLTKYADRWSDFGLDERETYDLIAAVPGDFRSVANFWHAFHAIYATHLGRPSDTSWGDKTPANVDGLAELIQIFPQARFIFMVRDVFDTTFSYSSMPIQGRTGNPLTGAQRWVDANTRILAFVERYAAQALLVRYEDLARLPEHEMARVLGHLGVAPSAAGALNPLEVRDISAHSHLKSVLHDVSTDYIGKGRANLADAVKQRICDIAAPLQIRLGYEPTGMHRRSCLAQ